MSPMVLALIQIIEALGMNPTIQTLLEDLLTSHGITQADLDAIMATIEPPAPPNTLP